MSAILHGFGYKITKLWDCGFIFNTEKPWLGTSLDGWIQACIIDDDNNDNSEDVSSKASSTNMNCCLEIKTPSKKAPKRKCINVRHTTQNMYSVSLEMKSSEELYTYQNTAVKSYTMLL